MSILFITDIPAPYRVEMYNALAQKMQNLEVWYFQHESKQRPWAFDASSMKHKYWIARGLYLKLKTYNLFFNPNLIIRLFIEKPKKVILATGWNDLDAFIIVLLKKARLLNVELSFWSEANHLTLGSRSDNQLKYYFRRFMYNSVDGFQLISGELTRITFRKWGVKIQKEIDFPNTISEEVHVGNEQISKQRSSEPPVILIAARLFEKHKGLINFFSKLSDDQVRKVKFKIAGDGPDKIRLWQYLSNRNLSENVELLGNLTSEEMGVLYADTDAFCLPSLSDPSPLSIIEALRWQLPLLVSNHCGNHFEAVPDNLNGNVFDPLHETDAASVFDEFLSRRVKWIEMGKLSGQIFDETFSKEVVLSNFVECIQK